MILSGIAPFLIRLPLYVRARATGRLWLLLGLMSISTFVSAATSGTTRFYLHGKDASEVSSTYNAMLPYVLPEGDTAVNGVDDSLTNFTAPPCEAAGFDLDTTAWTDEQTANAERCVATYYSPILGSDITFETTDTGSISYSLWAQEEGGCTTCVLKTYLYEYDEGDGTYTLINSSASAPVTAGIANFAWVATPTSDVVASAGNRLALVITMHVGAVPDATAGVDTVNVHFDRPTSAPAYMTLAYTVLTADKPAILNPKDDDFDETGQCTTTCNGTTLLTTPAWTIQTSGATTTESVRANANASTSWINVTDVQTAATVATSLANYTYIWQSALTADGDISAQVTASNSRTPTTNPRNLAGIALRFLADNNFLVLQNFYNGTNHVVQVNSNGVLTGSALTIDGAENNILLRWTKTGNSFQGKVCQASATDCTVGSNWTDVGTAIDKTGSTLDRVGLTSRCQWVTGTNTQYSSSFEWFVAQDTITPSAVSNFAGQAVAGSTSTLALNWSAPGDNAVTGTLTSGSQFAIHYATYAVVWSTSSLNDGVLHSSHVYISTSGVTAGSTHYHTLSGLSNGTTYYLRIWTSDDAGNWSPLSNGTTAQAYYNGIRTWTSGAGTAAWSNALNWTPTGTPLASDIVRLDATSTANSTIDTTFTISSLTVITGYTGTLTSSAGLTVLDDVNLESGAYAMGSSSWTVLGSWINTGGVFTVGTSTISLKASGSGELVNSGGQPFYNLAFEGAGGEWTTLSSSITVVNRLTMLAGTFTLGNIPSATVGSTLNVGPGAVWVVNSSVTVSGGSVTNSGTIRTDFSTATLSLNGAGTLGGSGGTTLPNLILGGAAQTTTLGGPVTLTGALTNLGSHTLDANGTGNYALTLSSGWVNQGTYIARSSSVTFNGGTSGNTIKSGASNFYKIFVNGSGSWIPVSDALTISSTVVVGAGTFSLTAGSSLTVAGSLAVLSGGALTVSTHAVIQGGALSNAGTITTTDAQAILTLTGSGLLGGAGSTTLPSLVLSGAGTTTMAGAVTLQGSMTNSASHTLDANASGPYALTVGGSWSNSGIYQSQGNTVTLNGAASDSTIQTNNSTFGGLTLNGTGVWSTLSGPLTVASDLTVTAGTMTLASPSSGTVQGSVSVGASGVLVLRADLGINGGSFTNDGTVISASTPTLSLAGNGTLGGSGLTVLPKMTLTGASLTTTMGGDLAVSGELTIGASHILDSNDSGDYTLTLSSNFVNLGSYESHSAAVVFAATSALTGQTTFYDLLSTVPGITLTFPSGSTQTITNSLTLSGGASNKIRLRSSAGTQHFLKVGAAATYSLSSLDVQNSNASGKALSASASTDSTGNTNWTFGNTKTWVGPGNWSSAANWSPSGVPGAGDSVVFSNTNACTIDLSTTVAQVDIQSGYSNTISANQNLTITGSFIQSGGTFQANSTTLAVGGNWVVTGGSFVPGTGTTRFTAQSTGKTIQSAGRRFYNVDFNGSGGYWTLQDSMTVTSSMTLTNGTLDTHSVGNYALSIEKEWLNIGGIFVVNASSVTMTGAGSSLRIRSGGFNFYKLAISGSGSFETNTDPLTVSSMVVLSAGSLTVASGSTMTVAGGVTIGAGATLNIQSDLGISGGTLSNAGSVTSSPGVTLTLSGTGVLGGAGGTVLPILDLIGVSQTTLAGPITVQGTLSNDSGHTLDAESTGNYAITLSSSWLNSGTYVSRSSSVTFNGSSSGLRILSGNSPFYKIVKTGSGSVMTDTAPVTVSSAVYVNAGTLTVVSGATMTVAGGLAVSAGATLDIQADMSLGASLTNAGTVSSTPGAVVSLPGSGVLGGSGGTVLPALVLGAGAFTTTLTGPITLQGSLTNGAGHTLDADATGNYPITLSGAWLNSGTYQARASSVTLTGSSAGLQVNSGGAAFYKLALNASGSYETASSPLTISSTVVLQAGTFTIASGSTMTVAGSLSVGNGAALVMNANLGLSGFLNNAGTITSQAGTLLLSSGTVVLGGSGSALWPDVTFAGAAQTTTLTSALVLQGTLTIASGHTLDVSASNYPITVGGSWSNAGAYSAQAGSVTFNGSGGSLSINPGVSNFYRLVFAGSGSWQTATNPVTVANHLDLASGSFTVQAGSTLTVAGDVDIQSGATLAISTHMAVQGGALTNAGTISSVNTSTLTLSGVGTLGGAGSSVLPHVVFKGSAETTTLGGALTVQGQFTNSTGHTVDAGGAYTMTVSSNWTNAGTFTPQTGTVVFDSTATLTGSTTFYNFTAQTPGITLTFVAGSTQAITGVLILNGEDLNLIRMRSTAASQYFTRVLGTYSILYVDVQYSRATGSGLNASASTNGGNNTNWTFGTTRVWDGSSSTLWNAAANWTPSGVPAALDSVVFNNTAGRNCSINITTTVAQVTIQSNFTRSITAAKDLTVTGSLSQAAGSFDAGAMHISIGGSLNLTGGTFVPGTSTMTFTSNSLGQSIATNNQSLNRMIFNGSGGGWTLQNNLVVTSTLTLASGILDTNSAGHYSLSVGGDWVNTGGAFVGNESTVTFTASTSGRSITSNGMPFSHVRFSGTGGWTLQDAMTSKNLTMDAGTLDTYSLGNLPITITGHAFWNAGGILLNASSVTVHGDWTRAGTSFTLGTSTVAFVGGGAKTLSTAGQPFYNLTFNDASGRWSVPGSSVIVQNAFSVQAGTFSLNGVSVSSFVGTAYIASDGVWEIDSHAAVLSGAWSNDGLIRTNVTSASITVTGSGSLAGSGSTTLPTLILSGNAQTTVLGSSISITGRLIVEANHTLDASNQQITFQGIGTPFILYGSWIPTGSTVAYSPSGAGAVTVSSTTFGMIQMSRSGTTFSLSGPLTVQSDLAIMAGILDVTASDWPITVRANWTNGDEFVARTGSVTFQSGSSGLVIGSGGSSFNALAFQGGGSWSLASGSLTTFSDVTLQSGILQVPGISSMTVGGNLDIQSGATVSLQSDAIIHGGSLTNAGTVASVSTATLTLSGTGTLGGTGSTQLPALVLSGNGQTTTLGGPLNIQGSLNNSSGHVLDANAANNYGITISSSWSNSGTYVARQSSVSFNGADVGQLIASAGSPFYNLAFTGSGFWQSSGGALTVSSSVFLGAGSFTVASGSTLTVSGTVDVESGATLALQADTLIQGGALSNAGTLTGLNTATLTLSNTGVLGGSGTNALGRVLLTGAGQTTMLGGAVSVSGLLQIGSGHTLDVDAGNSYTLTVSSALSNQGSFLARSGEVVFDADASLTGNTTFYDFTAVTPGITLTFASGSTQTVTGAFTLTGLTGNTIKLRSSTTLAQHFINSTGAASVSFANVKDSHASGNTLNASASTNAGGNTNWTFGTNYVWLGPGLFSQASNWSPSGNPGPLDSIRFNNTNDCTIDISTTVTRMTLDGTYTGTVTATQNLALSSDYIQSGGTFRAGSISLTVGANWTQTGGVFDAQTSTVIFNTASSGRTLESHGQPFHSVIFNGTGGYWTLVDSMTVVSSVTLIAGTLDTSASGNHALLVGRDWINTGAGFAGNASTVTFATSSSGRQVRTGGAAFGNVVFSGGSWAPVVDPFTATGLVTLQNNATVTVAGSSTMTARSATVDSGSTLALQSDLFIFSGGLANSGTVSSLSTATVTIAGNGDLGGSGGTVLPGLILSGSSNTSLAGPITVQGALMNGSGHSLDADASGNYAITLSSSWLNSGIYLSRASSVTFNGATSGLLIQTNGSPFHRLLVNGSGSWSTSGPLTTSSNTVLSGGTFQVVSGSSLTIGTVLDVQVGGTLSLQDDLRIGGTLIRSGTLTFLPGLTVTVIGAGSLNATGTLTLPNLVLTGNALTTRLGSALTLQGSLTNGSAHTLDADATGNYAITLSSSWLNSGIYQARSSSVTLSGSTSGLQIQSAGSAFYKLALQGSGGYETASGPVTVSSTVLLQAGTLTIASGSTMTVAGSLTLGSGAALTMNADLGLSGFLSNAGNITSLPGTVFTSSGTMGIGGSGSALWPDVTLTGNAQTTTLTSALVLQGTLTNASGHTLNVSGANYPITVGGSWSNAGVFTAQAGSVTLNGSSLGLTINPGSSNFYKLVTAGSGSWDTFASPVTVSSAVWVGAGTLTVTAGSSMTVVGSLDVESGGALDLQNHLTVQGGSLTNDGTVTSVNTSTLTLSGTGALGGSGTSTLPHMVLQGSGQTTTVSGDLAVQGQFTNSGGHTVDGGGAYTITVSSNWTNAGTFTPQTGTVVFNSTVTLTGSTTFYNFMAQTPGITLTFIAGSTQAVTGALTLSGGSGNLLRLRSNTATPHFLRVTGSHSITFVDVQWSSASATTLNAAASTNSGNNFNWVFGAVKIWIGATASWNTASNWNPAGVPGALETVIFNSGDVTSCTVNITTTIAQLQIQTGYTGIITANTNLTVTSNFSQVAGTLNMSTSTLTVGGSWSKTGGTFTPGTGPLVFNSGLPGQTIANGGAPFGHVMFSGSGGVWTLQSSMTVTTMTLTAGTLNTNAAGPYGVSVGADWLNNGGGFTPNQSTVTFTATTAGRRITSGGVAFGHVILNGSGANWTLQDAMTTLNLTHSTGTLNTNAAGDYPITIQGNASWDAGALVSNASLLSVAGNWTKSASHNFQVGTSSVAFTGISGSSSTLTGSTTFYNLVSEVPGKTLLFQNAVVQLVSGRLTLTGTSGNLIRLRSTSAPIIWYLKLSGPQSVSYVDVKDSNASFGNTIYAGQTSLNISGNTNWIFNFLPEDITTLNGSAESNGDVLLTWQTPLDSDDNPLGSGSQYVIQWATYTVNWTTSTASDTQSTHTWHVAIATSNTAAGSAQSAVIPGLTGNITYFFRIWTQDPLGYWSPGLSNGATVQVNTVLSVSFATSTYNFGLVNMGGTTVSTSAIAVLNEGNLSESYSLAVATTGALTVWGVGTAPPAGNDTFVLYGAFQAQQPAVSSFSSEDVIISTAALSTAAIFSTGGETGAGVAPGDTRHFWMRLDMPTITSSENQQQMILTITASTP